MAKGASDGERGAVDAQLAAALSGDLGPEAQRVAEVAAGALAQAREAQEQLRAERDALARQRVLEQQLNSAQRLDALSRLAGGIGHEFRNLLMVIQNYAEFLGEELPADAPARDDLAELMEAAERGGRLTNELLALGGRGIASARATDVGDAIAAAEPRLRASDDVELRIELPPDLPAVDADAERIGQIVEYLVRNAVEALEGTGTIRVEATANDLDQEYARDHPEIVPGSYVVLTVSDTGRGMPPEVADQVFDPFFTTKVGGRRGLGLAVVRGIVESWGGAVQVQSEVGVGTVVRALLPCASALAEEHGDLDVPAGSVSGRVLVCEDEHAIRSMCERVLGRTGFEVLVAEDGDAGIRRLDEERAAGRQLDLLVSDIVMPGSSGIDVAAAARERYPDVPILLMTGYSEELVARRVLPSGALVLEKPFAASLLVRRARALVARARG